MPATEAHLREDDTCQHVTEREEDGIAEAISTQQVFVEEHNANI
jgi:hypothetical protein